MSMAPNVKCTYSTTMHQMLFILVPNLFNFQTINNLDSTEILLFFMVIGTGPSNSCLKITVHGDSMIKLPT